MTLRILLLGKDDLYNSKNQIFYIVHSVWSVTLHFEKIAQILILFHSSSVINQIWKMPTYVSFL